MTMSVAYHLAKQVFYFRRFVELASAVAAGKF